MSAGARGGGGCIGENSSRSKYCNIWRDSYEFRVTPPASFYISHVSLLRYFVEILSRIHWAAAASWCARSMGSGKEKGGVGVLVFVPVASWICTNDPFLSTPLLSSLSSAPSSFANLYTCVCDLGITYVCGRCTFLAPELHSRRDVWGFRKTDRYVSFGLRYKIKWAFSFSSRGGGGGRERKKERGGTICLLV